MKRDPNAKKFMGIKPCGCVTWLYSAEFDTPREQERALAKAIKEGLRIERITDEDDARKRWGDCTHGPSREAQADPLAEARRLLGSAA